MPHFIFTILSIALFSAYLVATADYVNPTGRIRADTAHKIAKSLYEFEVGHSRFVSIYSREPDTLAELTPDVMFVPPAIIKEGAWSLGQGAVGGRYACLSGQMTAMQLAAVQMAQKEHSPQAFFINTGCGATVNNEAHSPGFGAITYWLSPYSGL